MCDAGNSGWSRRTAEAWDELDREGELRGPKKLLNLSSIACYDNMMQLVYIEEPMGHIYSTYDLRAKEDLILLNIH